MTTSTQNIPRLPATIGLVLFKMGYSLALVGFGSLLGVMAKDMGFHRSLGGGPLMGFSLGFIGGILLVTRPFLRQNMMLLVSLSASGMALVIGIWALCPSLQVLTIAWFLLGIFGVGHEVSSNSLLARLYPENVTGALVFYHSVWNIGAFFGPLTFGYLINQGHSWRLVPMVDLVVMVFCSGLLIYCGLKSGAFGKPAPAGGSAKNSQPKTATVWKAPLLFGFLLLCYTCTEMTLNAWAPTALQAKFELSDAKTAQLIGGFWGLMGVGRLIMGLLSKRLDPKATLIITTGLAFVMQLGLVLFQEFIPARSALWLTGLCLSSTVSWLIAVALALQEEHVEKTNTFLMFSCGMGLLLGPPLAGFASGQFGFQVILIASLCFNAALALGCGVIFLRNRKPKLTLENF